MARRDAGVPDTVGDRLAPVAHASLVMLLAVLALLAACSGGGEAYPAFQVLENVYDTTRRAQRRQPRDGAVIGDRVADQ
jgi:hypothetical protein